MLNELDIALLSEWDLIQELDRLPDDGAWSSLLVRVFDLRKDLRDHYVNHWIVHDCTFTATQRQVLSRAGIVFGRNRNRSWVVRGKL